MSTARENPNASDKSTKVICVFTEDYNDQEDVDRVRGMLREMNIENKLIYKLDRDVGKYSKDGHENLVQQVNYSAAYYQLLEQLQLNQKVNGMQLIESNDQGVVRFRLQKGILTDPEFERKKIRLTRLGFTLEPGNEHEKEYVFFRAFL